MVKKSSNYDSPLKKRREELGLTQRDVAEAIGAPVQTVSNWEVGKYKVVRLTLTQVKELGKILNWSLSDLPSELGPSQSLQDTKDDEKENRLLPLE